MLPQLRPRGQDEFQQRETGGDNDVVSDVVVTSSQLRGVQRSADAVSAFMSLTADV